MDYFNGLELKDPETDLNSIIKILKGNNQGDHILLLSFKDFIQFKLSKKKQKIVHGANLVFTSSPLLAKGYSWAYGKKISARSPFAFVLSLLTILENLQQSIYLLGEHVQIMRKAEYNLRRSYPNLQILGKFGGYFPPAQFNNLLIAINKIKPDLLLIGNSNQLKGNSWISQNKDTLDVKLIVYSDTIYKIFAGKTKPISSHLGKFMIVFLKTLIMPWRIFLLFPFLGFIMGIISVRNKHKADHALSN